MMDDLGVLKDYWYPVFMGSLLLYNILILYLHHAYEYDIDE